MPVVSGEQRLRSGCRSADDAGPMVFHEGMNGYALKPASP